MYLIHRKTSTNCVKFEVHQVLIFLKMNDEIPSTSIGSLEASSSATMHQTPTMTFTPRLCITSKGSKEWIPCCPLELKPVVVMLFDTLADDDNGNVLLKYVYCNKEGYNDNGSKKSNTTNKSGNQGKCVSSFTTRKRSVNRAGCKARIGFKRRKEGKYMTRDLEPEEFDAGWHSVMSEFGLQNHEWFVKMCSMNDQWIPSYFRNLFVGGMNLQWIVKDIPNIS
ncbi:Protein FAR-RED IMPAIRED RESPONSE 1 [Bienertia sinuspersici]